MLDHHRYLLAQHLVHLDFLDEQIAELEQQIAHLIAPDPLAGDTDNELRLSAADSDASAGTTLVWADAVALLGTIPGVGRTAAEHLIAELGTNMGQFATAAHLASWAKVSPGNSESAVCRRSGATGQGNRWLRSVLVQAAWAAVKVKDCPLAAVYHRLAGRRGAKRAILAVAHRILVAAYYMLRDQVPYREPGAAPADAQRKAPLLGHMLKRIEKLGYMVSLEPIDAAAT